MSNPHLYTPRVCSKCGHDLPEGLDRRSLIIGMIRTRPEVSLRRIAGLFEVSVKTLIHYAREAGIERARGGHTSKHTPISLPPMACPNCRAVLPTHKRNMAGDVVRFIKQHPELGYQAIGKRFGLHERTVKHYARAAKIKRARGGEPAMREVALAGVLTTEDVMRMTGRSRHTLYVWRTRGYISGTRLPDGTWNYDRASVEAHLKALTSTATPPL